MLLWPTCMPIKTKCFALNADWHNSTCFNKTRLQHLMVQATGQQTRPRYSHNRETKHCVIVQKKKPTTISNCVMPPLTKLSHNALPHVTVCMAHTPFKHSCFWHKHSLGCWTHDLDIQNYSSTSQKLYLTQNTYSNMRVSSNLKNQNRQ